MATPITHIRHQGDLVPALLHRLGLRAPLFHGFSLGAVALCLGLWVRAKTIGEDERGNAERRALFVGLWPPTLWLLGESLERQDRPPARRRLRF